MEFGYFTLSDNHYENNPRDANQFVSDITAEALYADQLGMHSAYIGSFSKPSIELAARLGYGLIVAPFAAAMSYGGLRQVADLYNETCLKHGRKPGRLMCSYFTHFYDNKAQEDAARARQIRYYKECVIPALPGDPKTAPPSYTYFIDMVKRLHQVQPEQLTENSVLLGNSQQITDT